jgi:hypothetical protein
MKKFLVCMIVAMFFIMIPFVSFAKKEILSDDALSSTTAQEGVTIQFGKNTYGGDYFFDTNFYIRGKFLPTLQSWGDGDGCSTCGGYTDKGWIGTSDVSMDPFVSLGLPAAPFPPTGSFVSFYRAMTIDVGTSGSTTKAFIGLPSVMVHPAGLSQTLSAGTTEALGQNFGTSYMSEFALVANSIGDGYLAISNHSSGQEGIDIQFSSAAATPFGLRGVMFSIPGKPVVNSWSDTDGDQSGATGYTSAGYFGANGLMIGDGTTFAWPGNLALFNILVTGTLSIDVGTNGSGNTAVVIGLPSVYFAPNGSITQPLGFAENRELSSNWQSLGTSYIGGISMTPSGSLTISAH